MKTPLDKDIRIEGKRYSAVIIYTNKILLMFRRKNGEEYFSLAGGHGQIGETGEETVVREILEETNLEIISAELIYNFINESKQEENFVYNCKIKSFKMPELVGEEKDYNSEENYYEPIWVALDKIGEITLFPLQLNKWLIKNLFTLKKS